MQPQSNDRESNIESLRKANAELRRLHDEGLVTHEEALRDLGTRGDFGLYASPWECVRNANLGFRAGVVGIRPLRPAQYARMRAEHELWTAGKLANAAGETVDATASDVSAGTVPNDTPDQWLFRADDEGASQEADAADKDWFFRMLEATFTPVESFEPIPEAIERFDAFLMLPHDSDGDAMLQVGLGWHDDDGLLDDPAPVGKAFRLTTKDGTQATLVIDERVDDPDELRRRKLYDDLVFVAHGDIEGYASPESGRERLVSVRDGEISQISYAFPYEARHDDPDYAAFRAYPRWQDHFAWLDDKTSRVEAARTAAMEAYLRELDDLAPERVRMWQPRA